MNIEKIDNVPSEILIRFNHGGSHQDQNKQLGEFEGAHYIVASVIIDKDTNEIIKYAEQPAKPLSKETAVLELLGEQFLAFEEQLRMTKENAKAQMDLIEKEREKERSEFTSTIYEKDKAIAALQAKLDKVREIVA